MVAKVGKACGENFTVLSERILESGEELKIEVDKKKKVKKGAEEKKEEETSRREEPEESKHMPALPFPQKLYREKLDKQFERFPDMLRQVNVNFPFIEVLSQKASLCQILEGDPYKEEEDRRDLSSQAYRALQRNLAKQTPTKVKLENEIGEIRSAPISFQLAGQTIIIPKGIVEDVLVRVDKFVLPMDFIVVKMEENKEIPLILGRPFLATSRAILDIHDRKLMLRVGEGTVTFEMNVEMRVKKEKPAASVE
ncbi:PREDICTED: uncharacterized protein LOC109232566 [Nicotiana attenuata]|uniref:uncharacterized protein LOC109232566 n=1 Tax=Nicotiana attenuata TaxID=49451 RepID=UPI000904E5A2|nr:PREDICTED: uncharacterized protein LOC109232566 [Nicotiana attenuata]